MKKTITFIAAISCFGIGIAQNVGIGISMPVEKLEVNGNVKSNGLTLNSGGAQHDFLTKENSSGKVGFKKGHGALGIHYIIATGGSFPTSSGGGNYNVTLVGEIKLVAGNFAPSGWVFCNGQLMSISANLSLFALVGTTYGGDGQTTFAVPDLRGAVPVGPGVSAAGYQWTHGEKSN